ncbi:MAG: UPF0236 family protein [Bacillota bacterium]|nr:UPF0236 family protein [Bacillota bacterium]
MSIIPSFSNCQIESSINSVLFRPYRITEGLTNYLDLLVDLDQTLNDRGLRAVVRVIEDMDIRFKASSYRKANYFTKGKYPRRIMTGLGELSFEREYYVDKRTGSDGFFYVDEVFGLPRRDYYDPYFKSLIVALCAEHSYGQSGEIAGASIGTRFKAFRFAAWRNISRQTVRNILKAAEPPDPIIAALANTPETIYVQMDEKFVHSQNQNGAECEIKLAVVYDGIQAVSPSRNVLLNRHVIGSIDGIGPLRNGLLDYLSRAYDLTKIKHIVLSGDGAVWIKNSSSELKLAPQIRPLLVLDRFHTFQAVHRMTTDPDLRDVLRDCLLHNRRREFEKTSLALVALDPEREEAIRGQMDYLLANWQSIQNQRSPLFKGCSMEGHISHFAAALFTARPKAHSLAMIAKRLAWRLLRINGSDIQRLYLEDHSKLVPSDRYFFDSSHAPRSVLDSTDHRISYIYQILKASGEIHFASSRDSY